MKEETRAKRDGFFNSPIGRYLLAKCRFKNKSTGRWTKGKIISIGYNSFAVRFKNNQKDENGKQHCKSDTILVKWDDVTMLEWWE